MTMATDFFDLAESIRHDCPELRYTSGRWIIGDRLAKNFRFDVISYLRKKSSRVFSQIKNPQQSANLERIMLDEYSDDPSFAFPLSSLAMKAKKEYSPDEYVEMPGCFDWIDNSRLIIINRVIFHAYEDERFFIFAGKAGSGKSTFTNLLCQLDDKDFAAIENSRGSNYDFDQIVTKRIAYADDIQDGVLPIEEARLKTIATHGDLAIDPKLQQKRTIRKVQSKVIFCSNWKPHLNIGDSGVLRRICWFAMDKPIANPDTSVKTREYSERELVDLLKIALSWDEKFKKQEWFSWFEQETKDNVAETSSVYQFYKDKGLSYSGGTHYLDYVDWCKDNGIRGIYSKENYSSHISLLKSWGKIKNDFERFIGSDE